MISLVLATSNKGKIAEISRRLAGDPALADIRAVAYSALLGEFPIEETGTTFQQNAAIKARAVAERLDPDTIVLADDSGISVPALGGEPGIYSARYAKEGASDRDNVHKLIGRLAQEGIARTEAFYTACMAIAWRGEVFTVHGWMYGDVIADIRGDKGFGYDPMFIPEGFDRTLGELDDTVKERLSHRTKALDLAMTVIRSLR